MESVELSLLLNMTKAPSNILSLCFTSYLCTDFSDKYCPAPIDNASTKMVTITPKITYCLFSVPIDNPAITPVVDTSES